jgi:hypothetical protein
MFEFIPVQPKRKPLYIYEKRWYFTLVKKENGYTSALMDHFSLNDIYKHVVVCFTPNKLPGKSELFRKKDGDFIRLYAFFDSYIELFLYIQKFEVVDRAFYEIVFGEFQQKPHFDIDISKDDFNQVFLDAEMKDVDVYFSKICEDIKDTVIDRCIEIFKENNCTFNIEKDLLLYSSHSTTKRSFHIVINNWCHDNNKEANAFYNEVIKKVDPRYVRFIDNMVYSPKQQFRIIGSQKPLTNRPKVFYEEFVYNNQLYKHQYTEDANDIVHKKLIILYESLVGFVSNCKPFPCLIKEVAKHEYKDQKDLTSVMIDKCMNMLDAKLGKHFTFDECYGHVLSLKRTSASYCQLCSRIHEKQHPYMFIVNGKLYWNCRRRDKDDKTHVLIGYIDMPTENTPTDEEEENEEGEFTFGGLQKDNASDSTIPSPLSPKQTIPSSLLSPKQNIQSPSPLSPKQTIPSSLLSPTQHSFVNDLSFTPKKKEVVIPPPPPVIDISARKVKDVRQEMLTMSRNEAKKKYIKKEGEDLTGIRKLPTDISWY